MDLQEELSRVFDEVEQGVEGDAVVGDVADDVEGVLEEEVTDPDSENPESDDVEIEDQDEEELESQEEEPEELTAPEHWKKEHKDAFSSLDDEGKKVLLEQSKSLESGANRKFREIADITKEHEAIVGLMQPFEAQLNAAGMDRIAGIRSLVGAQQMLNQNPEAGLRQLITQYGGQQAKQIVSNIASEMGLISAAESEADDYRTPNEIELQNRLDKLEAFLQQNQITSEQKQRSQVDNQINLFANAENDGGELLHPHFEAVRGSMGAMISAAQALGQELSLDDAYERAIYADPEIRKQLINNEVNGATSKVQKTRIKKVSEAKKASRNPKSRTVAPDLVPQKDLRDEIADLVDGNWQ